MFDTILSSLPDLSFTFDLDGRFSHAHKALTVLLELPLEKIVGKIALISKYLLRQNCNYKFNRSSAPKNNSAQKCVL